MIASYAGFGFAKSGIVVPEIFYFYSAPKEYIKLTDLLERPFH